MRHSNELSQRIRNMLEQASAANLLSDDKVSWDADEVRRGVRTITQIIESNTLPGLRVGVCFPNWAAQSLVILATLATGRIPVILSYTDVDQDPAAWLARTELSLLFTAPGFEKALEGVLPYVTLSQNMNLQTKSLQKSVSQWMKNLAPQTPAGTALIMFTSGSTGNPKGIFVPVKGLLKTIDFLIGYFNLNRESVAPIIFPICHSMALNTQFLPTFLAGGRCYFSNSRVEIGRLYRTILAQQGTFVSLIGDVLGACSDERKRRNLPAADHVEHVQLAGGLITPTHLQFAKELFPKAKIHKGYGLTEAIRATMIDSSDSNFSSEAVGRPLPFVQIEIRDENGKILSAYEVGEVFIKGDNVMLGSTVDHHSVNEDGFLPTGDLGYFNNEGQLCISGRKDSLFKINGLRVSGLEIEKAARETSSLIKNAKCLGVEDERRGRTKIVLLLEIPSDLQTLFCNEYLEDVHEQIWQKFQGFSHFPKEILLLEKFPRTSNGKLALQKMKEFATESKKTVLNNNYKTALQFLKIQEGTDSERLMS